MEKKLLFKKKKLFLFFIDYKLLRNYTICSFFQFQGIRKLMRSNSCKIKTSCDMKLVLHSIAMETAFILTILCFVSPLPPQILNSKWLEVGYAWAIKCISIVFYPKNPSHERWVFKFIMVNEKLAATVAEW